MVAVDRSPLNFQRRAIFALIVVVCAFVVLLLRLWHLQIVRGEYFRIKSEENRLRTVYVPANRGLILDRNGTVLARNRPSFNIELIVEDAPDPVASIDRLAEVVGQERGVLQDRAKDLRRRKRFEPRLLLRDVSRDLVAKVLSHKHELPGIIVSVVPTREYIRGDFAAHTLGYIREITKLQLDSPRYAGYMQGDLVGQYGLESHWEQSLQGKRGEELVVVNAAGARIGEYSFQSDLPGHNLTLTIDADVQQAADDSLKGLKGAIVAMDVRTGEILALSSAPRFDPNKFAGELDSKEWADLVSGPDKRLSHRALQGAYPPGSVFKIFMAVAALAEGIVSPNDRVNCPGYLNFGGRPFRCHKKSGHGSEDLRGALIESCDVYFYTVGNRLGIDRIHEYASRFGFGVPTGLELVQESRGIVPSTAWKRRFFRNPAMQKWFPGETLSVAIGQGATTVTPLQVTRAVAALVNGGKVMRPYILRRIDSSDGTYHDDEFAPHQVGSVDVDPKILDTVRDFLLGVVNDPRGTARRARLDKTPEILVGGKTGTAQVVGLEHGTARHGDHAWFAAFAPGDKPEIAVTALVENGGHGGVAAAPLVKAVLEAYFKKTRGLPVDVPTATPTPKPQKNAAAKKTPGSQVTPVPTKKPQPTIAPPADEEHGRD